METLGEERFSVQLLVVSCAGTGDQHPFFQLWELQKSLSFHNIWHTLTLMPQLIVAPVGYHFNTLIRIYWNFTNAVRWACRLLDLSGSVILYPLSGSVEIHSRHHCLGSSEVRKNRKGLFEVIRSSFFFSCLSLKSDFITHWSSWYKRKYRFGCSVNDNKCLGWLNIKILKDHMSHSAAVRLSMRNNRYVTFQKPTLQF